MAFMTSKKLSSKNFEFLILFIFVYLLTSYVILRSHMTLFLSREGASVQILRFFLRRIRYEFTGFGTNFSQKK